jgi:hypothetical protein
MNTMHSLARFNNIDCELHGAEQVSRRSRVPKYLDTKDHQCNFRLENAKVSGGSDVVVDVTDYLRRQSTKTRCENTMDIWYS